MKSGNLVGACTYLHQKLADDSVAGGNVAVGRDGDVDHAQLVWLDDEENGLATLCLDSPLLGLYI